MLSGHLHVQPLLMFFFRRTSIILSFSRGEFFIFQCGRYLKVSLTHKRYVLLVFTSIMIAMFCFLSGELCLGPEEKNC